MNLERQIEDYCENKPLDSCPQCGRFYDEIDRDYQYCSKCGWDAEEEKYDESGIREPEDSDYDMGEADLMTGQWY